jgi:hypothetical protein
MQAGFVLVAVALGQLSAEYFSPVTVIPTVPHAHSFVQFWRYIISAIYSVIK